MLEFDLSIFVGVAIGRLPSYQAHGFGKHPWNPDLATDQPRRTRQLELVSSHLKWVKSKTRRKFDRIDQG